MSEVDYAKSGGQMKSLTATSTVRLSASLCDRHATFLSSN